MEDEDETLNHNEETLAVINDSLSSSSKSKREALLQKQNEARELSKQSKTINSPADEQKSSAPSTPAPLREKMVTNAVQFLSHDSVKTTPLVRQIAFLENKGLTNEEITEAFKRVNGSSPTVTSTPTPISTPTAQTIISNPSVIPQTPPRPPPPPPPRSSFSTIATTVVLTLGAVGGLRWLFNSFILPAMKDTPQKQEIIEPKTPQHQINNDNELKEQMTELVRAVKTQQSEIKDSLKIVHTVLTTPDRFSKPEQRVTDQVNVKELTNAISALQQFLENSKTNQSQPNRVDQVITPLSSQSVDPNTKSISTSTNSKANTATPLRAQNQTQQPTSTSTSTPTNPAGYSKSFLDVMKKVHSGEPIPGIQTIDDSPLDSSVVVNPSRTTKPSKPWESRRQQRTSTWKSQTPDSTLSPSYLKTSNVQEKKQKELPETETETETDNENENKNESETTHNSQNVITQSEINHQITSPSSSDDNTSNDLQKEKDSSSSSDSAQ